MWVLLLSTLLFGAGAVVPSLAFGVVVLFSLPLWVMLVFAALSLVLLSSSHRVSGVVGAFSPSSLDWCCFPGVLSPLLFFAGAAFSLLLISGGLVSPSLILSGGAAHLPPSLLWVVKETRLSSQRMNFNQ